MNAKQWLENAGTDKAMGVIMQVGNQTHQAILRLRYVEGKTWTAISDEMHYSESRCYALHMLALIEIERILREGNEVEND